jgi:hypothetical protein
MSNSPFLEILMSFFHANIMYIYALGIVESWVVSCILYINTKVALWANIMLQHPAFLVLHFMNRLSKQSAEINKVFDHVIYKDCHVHTVYDYSLLASLSSLREKFWKRPVVSSLRCSGA